VADPRPLATRIANAAPAGLPPKATVLVDGGGTLHLAAEAADVRLVARANGWLLGCGADWLGLGDADAALAATLHLLADMAREAKRRPSPEARAATAGLLTPAPAPPPVPAPDAIGTHQLRTGVALGVGLPFGRLEAAALIAFAGASGARALLAIAFKRSSVDPTSESGTPAAAILFEAFCHASAYSITSFPRAPSPRPPSRGARLRRSNAPAKDRVTFFICCAIFFSIASVRRST
jgi:hypothetical protein